MEKNWRRWKDKKPMRKKTMKMIPENEEIKEEKLKIREWMEEDDDKMDNLVDPYYEL